jgi:hypothetical protein
MFGIIRSGCDAELGNRLGQIATFRRSHLRGCWLQWSESTAMIVRCETFLVGTMYSNIQLIGFSKKLIPTNPIGHASSLFAQVCGLLR